MSGEERGPVETIDAPYGRRIGLQPVAYESGLRLLRVTIREGRRFTVIEIDAETARRWAAAMNGWADTTEPIGNGE